MKIFILTDYRSAFYSSTTNIKTLCSLNLNKIRNCFEKMGYIVVIMNFSDIDFTSEYKNAYVLYTSSEDRGLKYRSYIEDMVLFLRRKGAIIIPDYEFLRAHHNKSYMEMLRYCLFPEQAEVLETKIFGTFEDLSSVNFPEQQYVLKSAYGAGSKFVYRSKNRSTLLKAAKRISQGVDIEDIISEYKKRIFWKEYHKSSLNRNKFIVQNYIEGLSGDFKVLKYGERYYFLYRQNRPNDFRASGGGRLDYCIPHNVKEQDLLSFAKKMSDRIDSPLCSLDIAWNGLMFILLEFQCLSFGPYTAEKSDYYYIYVDGKWEKKYEKCDIENVFSIAIDNYIREDI